MPLQIPLPSPGRLEQILSGVLRLSIGTWLLFAIAMLFVLTLGTDEAWVLNGLRSSLHEHVPDLSTELIATSGGLYALVNVLIEWTLGSRLWVHRLASLLFFLGSVLLILRSIPLAGVVPSNRWLLAVPMLALPGAAEVGTAALGTSVGLFLMLAALLVWSSRTNHGWRRVVGTGVLYGLAAASRLDLVFVGPAILLCSSLALTQDWKLTIRFDAGAWLAVLLGLAFLGLCMWLMSLPANGWVANDLGVSTGVNAWAFNYPKLLNRWATLATFVPVGVLAMVALGALVRDGQRTATLEDQSVPRLETLLTASGAILLLAWVLQAPIPHLRYAFAGLFCFAAAGSIALARLLESQQPNRTRGSMLLYQLAGIAFMASALGLSARSLVMANADIASWEWSNETPQDYFRRFEAPKDEAAVVAYLETHVPGEAIIYSHAPYALRYLARRPVTDPKYISATEPGRERYLVLTPAVGPFFHMTTIAANWINDNTKLVAQFGRYSVYRFDVGSGADLSALILPRTNYLGHPGSEIWFGRSFTEQPRSGNQ